MLQQPKPRPSNPHTSFLKSFVDPLDLDDRSGFGNSVVSNWLESLCGLEREKHCQSDSYLYRPATHPVSRNITKSAPAMGGTRDADGFAVPPTPASTGSRPYELDGGVWAFSQAGSLAPSDASSERASKKSLVEESFYRTRNLISNHIYLRGPNEDLPQDIAKLVQDVSKDRDSPGPSSDQLKDDEELHELENGVGEPAVENYFKDNLFPKPKLSCELSRTDRQPMFKHAVPDSGSKLKVSTPVPDMLYGYTDGAFAQQQTQLMSMGTSIMANNLGLIYPFFVIEFKGDGPLWVATNQCAGGSASSVNIAERLNWQLRKCNNDQVRLIDSAAFSVAMNGTEARLYISWKHNELDYYMRKIESFLLQRPDHYVVFRKYVRNIIDWGKDARLKEIRESLDLLLEENRKRLSEAAKARPAPGPEGSATSSGKKRRSSSKSAENQGKIAVVEPYWQWDSTCNRYFHLGSDGSITWAEEQGQASSAP